jgi:hypothetical protein
MRGRRLSHFDACLIVLLVCAALGLGAWAVVEWLPRSNNTPIGQQPIPSQ